MTDQITGGQLVVRMLESLGVRHVFGVPGGQTLAITDAIIDSPTIEFVTARHENAAAVMADAYGRLTGTPGVCISTTGPGATNLITGVGGAYRDSSPMLVLTCNNNGENIYKDDAQNADHVDLFSQLTKYSRLVAHGSSLVQAIEEAYVNAMTGNPGPAHLDFARDTIEGKLDAPIVPAEHPMRAWVRQRPRADAAALAAAVARIADAERPVIWAGNGVNRSGASASVLAFAEALNIPIVTTFNGIGSVPSDHPLVFGALSRMGTNLSTRVIKDADLVLAVGNSLNAVSTGRWRLPLPEVIQIDIDPAMIGRYYGGQTTGIVADAREVLDEIREVLGDRAGELAAGRASWIESLDSARTTWAQATAGDEPIPSAGTLAPADIVRRLSAIAPADTVLIPDAGNPGVWSFLWQVKQGGTYLKPVGFGNMGFAVPAAIASATVDPKRPVVVLVGDGSLGMTLGELETVVRVGGRVVIVVLNDNGYGNIRQEQVKFFDGRTIGVDFGPADYSVVADGFGLESARVTDLDELVERVEAALRGSTPVLFDVPIDPEISAWTFPAFLPYDPEEG